LVIVVDSIRFRLPITQLPISAAEFDGARQLEVEVEGEVGAERLGALREVAGVVEEMAARSAGGLGFREGELVHGKVRVSLAHPWQRKEQKRTRVASNINCEFHFK